MTVIDEKLAEYATPRQLDYITAINIHGSIRKAAKALNVGKSSICNALESLKKAAARQGYAPGHFASGTAPGFSMGKVTVQRGADGSVERTWERQSPEQAAALQALRDFALSLSEDVKGLAPIVAPPRCCRRRPDVHLPDGRSPFRDACLVARRRGRLRPQESRMRAKATARGVTCV